MIIKTKHEQNTGHICQEDANWTITREGGGGKGTNCLGDKQGKLPGGGKGGKKLHRGGHCPICLI